MRIWYRNLLKDWNANIWIHSIHFFWIEWIDIIAIDYGAIRSRFVCGASMQMGFDWILAGLEKSLLLLLMIFRFRIQIVVLR